MVGADTQAAAAAATTAATTAAATLAGQSMPAPAKEQGGKRVQEEWEKRDAAPVVPLRRLENAYGVLCVQQ